MKLLRLFGALVLSLSILVEAAEIDLIKRPSKPSKTYTIGILEPNMAIPHFVAQSYGFIDEAQILGMRFVIYDAGEHKNMVG